MDTSPHKAASAVKKQSFLKDIVVFAAIALAIVLPIRFFIAQPFIVSGSSMDPTFADRQYLIVDEISYRFEAPKRDDVIIFKYPNDTTKYFIKRVIGLPGETVQVEGTKVTIKNTANPQGFTLDEPYIAPQNFTQSHTLTTLGPNQYFVMGDNRGASFDSRSWGPVDKSLIIGRPILRLFPFSEIGFFPGAASQK